jgi:hypothetical protein
MPPFLLAFEPQREVNSVEARAEILRPADVMLGCKALPEPVEHLPAVLG